MKSESDGINPAAKPSGMGCVECSAAGGWWFHLRRCAECGHIGCCDSSPSQHASKHYGYGSPGNHELRAGRAVVLRLPYRRLFWRPEASRSSLASVGTTSARTGRSGAFKLANAASRIGVGRSCKRCRIPGHSRGERTREVSVPVCRMLFERPKWTRTIRARTE
jgi:hypothetical protein